MTEDKASSRPASFYDNIPSENVILREDTALRNSKNKQLFATQEHLVNTTVPQRIITTNNKGVERHTPTRNSLRHSRMIVLNTHNVPRKSLPPIIRFYRIAKCVVSLKLIIGLILCLLSIWLLFLTPNLRRRDNPFWSALTLLFSGIFGIILLCCCHKEYPRMPNGYCVYAVKVFSIFLSITAGISCLIAATFASLHTLTLLTADCQPTSLFSLSSSPLLLSTVINNNLNDTSSSSSSSCYCHHLPTNTNSTSSSSSSHLSPTTTSLHYSHMTCAEVTLTLQPLVWSEVVGNVVGGALALYYVYLHWKSRYYLVYSTVAGGAGHGAGLERQPVVVTSGV